MGNVTIFAVFMVLIASLAISAWSSRSRRSNLIQNFLFEGNTPLLAISSCIGSIISMAVSFTALLSAGYLWGWQITFSMIAGGLAGLAAILTLSAHPAITQNAERVEQRSFISGVSYLAIFGSLESMPYYGFLMAAYTAMLITEMVVLRTFISFLSELPRFELLLLVGTVLLVCYAYVYIGGFRGVLVTDYFQLLVVFVFIGLWIASISQQPVAVHLPSPSESRIVFTAWTRVLLHAGCFAGGFAWTFANTDQWFRTYGTLKVTQARRVLITSALTMCAFSVVPVLAGAAVIGRPTISPAITNGISLVLVGNLLIHASVTLRFVFAMALTCAALTTLNTYLMTLQQLYYEASTRIDSKHYLHYLLINYPLKWKAVRGVVFLITVVAFVASCFFPDRYVYTFGVASLSMFVVILPFLGTALAELIAVSPRRWVRAAATSAAIKLAERRRLTLYISVVGWLLLLAAGRVLMGALTLHLYIIPATALAATATATLVTLSLRTPAWQGVLREPKDSI